MTLGTLITASSQCIINHHDYSGMAGTKEPTTDGCIGSLIQPTWAPVMPKITRLHCMVQWAINKAHSPPPPPPRFQGPGHCPGQFSRNLTYASEARTRVSLICKQTQIFTFNNITAAYMCGSQKLLYFRNITVIFTLHSTEKIQDLHAKFGEIGPQIWNKHRQKLLYFRNITVIFTLHSTEKIQDLHAKFGEIGPQIWNKHRQNKVWFYTIRMKALCMLSMACAFNPLFAIVHINHPFMVTV